MGKVVANTKAVSLIGIEGVVIDVQVMAYAGLYKFTIVGLPDSALSEAKERIRPAFLSSNFDYKYMNIVASLSPANIPKYGSGFDLPIAAALLAANNEISCERIKDWVHIGELALDGTVKEVSGILPVVLASCKAGFNKIIVPYGNQKEAKLVKEATIVGVSSLGELAKFHGCSKYKNTEFKKQENEEKASAIEQKNSKLDLNEVLGQEFAKFALEIAASGGHHILMTGPPGTGKSMLASRLPTILPSLTNEQAMETTSIRSIAGVLCSKQALTYIPPFEAPHHTATAPSIIGGGSGMARPGAVSLAHNGILFLDEAPEFSASVLQTLRTPLENGTVNIYRAMGVVKYPARFQMIMASNPCPCGHWQNNASNCTCSSITRRRYFSRLSGPLLDRVDLKVIVEPVMGVESLKSTNQQESSNSVLERVLVARKNQQIRYKNTPWKLNCQVPGSYLRKISSSAVVSELHLMLDKGILSMRGVDKVLRVAWTLADMKSKKTAEVSDINLALSMRVRLD